MGISTSDQSREHAHIVRNHDQAGLLGLDQRDGVVETRLDEDGLLAILLDVGSGLTVGDRGGLTVQSRLLFLLRLRAVLVQETEESSRGVLVERVLELSDGRRDLQALVEDSALALKADVGRPLDEAACVRSRRSVTTDRVRSRVGWMS